MIRLILVVLAVVLYLIFSIPVLSYLKNLEKKDPKAAAKKSLDLVRWILGIVRDLAGITYEVRGLEHIPSDRAVLYVGNHRSYFDIVMGYTTVPAPTGFIAKKEMIGIPLLSQWMVQMNCLFLDRSNIKEGLKTILTGIEKVKGGISMWIFPEGTRNKNADETEMLPFHDGSFKIAARAKSPIIPIAISNSANIWEANFPKMTPTHVVIEYGKPIIPSELDRDTQRRLGSYTQDIIKEMLIKNKELV